MFEQAFKGINEILRKESGYTAKLDPFFAAFQVLRVDWLPDHAPQYEASPEWPACESGVTRWDISSVIWEFIVPASIE